jgi:hypothetical protein
VYWVHQGFSRVTLGKANSRSEFWHRDPSECVVLVLFRSGAAARHDPCRREVRGARGGRLRSGADPIPVCYSLKSYCEELSCVFQSRAFAPPRVPPSHHGGARSRGSYCCSG